MARTTEQIMQQLLAAKDQDETLRERLTSTSKTAIWRLLLYICAFCAHSVEVLMDAFKADVRETVEKLRPHSARWYQEKARQFMMNKTLPEGSDTYDTTGMTDDQIAQAQVVKYAAVVEKDGEVIVKAAKGDGIHVNATVYYDPQRTSSDVRNDIITAVRGCVEALPFNGELTAMAIEDAMQNVDGVKVVTACAIADANDGRVTPAAGWFKWTDESLTTTLTPYA